LSLRGGSGSNLPKNSRPTELRLWKHVSPHWTVCGVAPSVHLGRQIADVSEKLPQQQLMYTNQKDTGVSGVQVVINYYTIYM